jgi:hypothetical protein
MRSSLNYPYMNLLWAMQGFGIPPSPKYWQEFDNILISLLSSRAIDILIVNHYTVSRAITLIATELSSLVDGVNRHPIFTP